MRPATAEERREDFEKRKAALEAGIEHGYFSKAQAEQHWRELEVFKGYPRPIEDDTLPVDRVCQFLDLWENPTHDGEPTGIDPGDILTWSNDGVPLYLGDVKELVAELNAANEVITRVRAVVATPHTTPGTQVVRIAEIIRR